ncbi:hypothetical protein EI94DRAFT_1562176 [Lactarius quietus]|nr:hypothetical protein EI94DRAFT_1562176 [Lactarius quietus]
MNQTCCFAHTLSISAKAILKQFDIPKGQGNEVLDVAAQAFADLAKELNLDEQLAHETQDVKDGEEDDQPLDSWVNFHEGLTEEEVTELDESIQPMRSMLIKLRKMAFALKNSMTLLLLHWYKTLSAHSFPHHMMPHDVSTWWNLTFDMLNFMIEYHPTINTMMATQDFELQKYELVPVEWKIAGELHNVLQVGFLLLTLVYIPLLKSQQIFKDTTLFFL